MWHFGWGMNGMWLNGVFWVLIIGLVFWGIKAFVAPSHDSASHHHETALDILKKRYARGEIDDEEFERKKQHLQ